jgi:energy-coupling factor transport system substrate-specific component|tara:strand:+ start:564 stop:1328 length:765 start_codon:yes stop_codon:yes gene_type:complete
LNWQEIVDWASTPGGIAVWLTLALGLFFGTLLISVDRRMRLGREAALIALLAAVASASRVLFAALPNVQPVTLFILMIGLHLGARRATAVAMLTALLSNMALGHGPWTFYQAIAWALVGSSSALLRPLLVNWDGTKVRIIPMAILAFIWGFLFDWIVSMSALAIYQSFEAFLTFILAGLIFDAMHAFGNVLFTIWLAPSLHSLLWLHRRHEAGRWHQELPNDTVAREVFISDGNASQEQQKDPFSEITRLDGDG